MYDFSTVTEVSLSEGCHTDPKDGLCFMEMAAWFAGEKHSDEPECSCPVLGAYGIRLNDEMPDDFLRNKYLRPMVPLIVGTRDVASQQKRAQFLAMWAVNKILPITLRANGFDDLAATCEMAADLEEAKAAAAAAYAAAYADAAVSIADTFVARAAAMATVSTADATYTNNATDAANAAIYAAVYAANKEQIWQLATEGLRQAILIGKHEAVGINWQQRHEDLRTLVEA